ncbi:MAG: UbiD family decarboxylase [Pirellulaceae bacterium]|nr:UbiD family decarboxylase [Pirellulaceae bacterium]
MVYRSTRSVVADLRKHGRLIEIDEPVSPTLEIAEIQRRVYARGGPAILFTHPIGTSFPMVGNLFGSIDQARFLFRHTLDRVRKAIELKIDPAQLLARPWRYWSAPFVGWNMLPKKVRTGPVLKHRIEIDMLPQLVSWPDDGGAFITLPQVLSQAPTNAGATLSSCNLGMYRVQLAGNEYVQNSEIGLHYQIHRGIGVHHQAALATGKPLRVAISVGGSPAMTLSAVMPLPEGMSELTFAGALAGHRIPMVVSSDHAPLYADADFVIYGEVDLNSMKPEGPFGDHLGYYSKQHPFPWLRVHGVYHRPDAIWPFTVVGRPPQEDTTFGMLIHELTGPIVPTVLPGVKGVHAVDAAGVHPLMLAIGSERYTPSRSPDRPQELLTQANAILGQGQMSLAKYLMIVNSFDQPDLDVHNIEAFLRHLLSRIDWTRDLHFQTKTTIDTLDYSGHGFNQGSKVVMAASGRVRRRLSTELPAGFELTGEFHSPRWCMPGVLAVSGPSLVDLPQPLSMPDKEVAKLIAKWESLHPFSSTERERSGVEPPEHHDLGWNSMPLVVIVDDSIFTSQSLNNFLWVTFTRSDPAADIFGVGSFVSHKHWGCCGPLLIDARRKPHHAPPLVESSAVSAKIDAMAAHGGPIAQYI